jgi:hypothetical protein
VITVLAALTDRLSMRIVGILLIAALMVLPVIAAQRVAWSLRSTMAISIAIGLASVLVGYDLVLRRPAARRDDRADGDRAVRRRVGGGRGARAGVDLGRVPDVYLTITEADADVLEGIAQILELRAADRSRRRSARRT